MTRSKRSKDRDIEDIIRELQEAGTPEDGSSIKYPEMDPNLITMDNDKYDFTLLNRALYVIAILWVWGYISMKNDEHVPQECGYHYSNFDPNRSTFDILYWDNENKRVVYPEELGLPPNFSPNPTPRATGSHEIYYYGNAYRRNTSGVELDLGHGISVQTGLDESEIIDQIAADGDIYSLTDYFDEYVGD